jgi:hypothetical protein
MSYPQQCLCAGEEGIGCGETDNQNLGVPVVVGMYY